MTDEITTHDKPKTISESVHHVLTEALPNIKAAMEVPEFDGKLQVLLMVVPNTDGVPTETVTVAAVVVALHVSSLTPEEYTDLVTDLLHRGALQEAREMDFVATAPSTGTRQ